MGYLAVSAWGITTGTSPRQLDLLSLCDMQRTHSRHRSGPRGQA